MGGSVVQRGVIIQSIIAMLESLERDDWDAIKVEPETKNDKVDIMLYRDGKPLSAIQVKSSTNSINRSILKKWLDNLKADSSGAKEICLFIVGDSYSPSCESFIADHSDEIKRIPFENLQSICTGILVKYLRQNGIIDGEVRVDDLEFIQDDLFAKLLKNSIEKEPITRVEFEECFRKALPVHVMPKCLTPIPAIDNEVSLIGRDDIKKYIRETLLKNGGTLLVNGLGGIGKTAIMQHICNDIKNEGKYVAWIECGASLKADLLLLRTGLGIPESDDDDVAYGKVIKELTENKQLAGNFYLFLDNLSHILDRDELAVLNELDIHVLATSRFEQEHFVNLSIDILERKSIIDMFYGYYKRDKERRYADYAWEIIDSVHSHTLLVELLAKAASAQNGSLDVFRDALKAKGVFNVFKKKLSTGHDNSMSIEECIMALYKISGLTYAQEHIMKLFTIFTPEKEIYYRIGEWANLDMDAVDKLVDLGWLERVGLEGGYQIHQIVRDSIARQMEKNGEKVRLEDYGELLDKIIDTNGYLGKDVTYEKIRERIVITEDVARFLVESGREDIDVGKLFNNMVVVYYVQGIYEKALEYCGKAVAIQERVLGTEHPDTASAYNNMAAIYYKQGEYEKALEYCGKAVAIQERVLGTEHPDTASTYNHIASIYNKQGEYEKALEYCGKAVTIQERVIGTEHPNTASAYNNLAAIYNKQGEYEKALEYCEKAVAIQERVLGTEYPDTASTYNNMAAIYYKQGEYEKALEYCGKAVAIQERVLGTEHPDTASAYNNLAAIYNKQGEYEKALEYCEKAAAIIESVLGTEHPDTVTIKAFLQEMRSKDNGHTWLNKWLDDYFSEYNDSYTSFASLQQYIEKENLDVFQAYPDGGLGDIFRFANAKDTERKGSEIQELLELLWKLYLVDSDRIIKAIVPFVPKEKYVTDKNDENTEKTDLDEKNSPNDQEKDEDTTKQSKPKPSDLEDAIVLVLNDFKNWWEEKADRMGLTFSIAKDTTKQNSGWQFGYDVGLNTEFGGLKYRLRFECKDYTSNISKGNQGKNTNLKVRNYAYNLLQYFMFSDSRVNMRWILICPFGGLQNDFPERLFERWNEEHTFIKIYAIMERASSISCKDFLSVNKDAYRKVYKTDYDGKKTKDDVFKDLYDKIIGTDDVREAALKRLKKYVFWDEYGGHKGLLPVPDSTNQIALKQIISFLQRKKENIDDERKKTLFVIGEYGTGKSWLCYRAIEQIVLHPSDFPFMPFYLRLKDLSQKKDLEDKTQYKDIMKGTLKEFSEKYDEWAGECVRKALQPVFFLDGFDEVFSGLSATDKKIHFLLRIISELKEWYEKYENERDIKKHTKPLFVITSRESDFEVGMKSKDFQDQMDQAEIIELEMCSIEEVQKEWNSLEEEDHTDRSWIFKLEQNSAFLNIIRRPVFYRLCSDALKDDTFKQKVDLASVDEVDVLDMLFEYELQNYAREERINKKEIQREIYKCAVECSKEKKSQVVYAGKGINQKIHVGMVKIQKDQEIAGTCWVSFEHNIVREYLTARFLSQCLIDCSTDEIADPMRTTFIQTLQELSLTPEALKFLLLCIEKKSPMDKGKHYKEILKKWLCNKSIKYLDSSLSARILEILLQPGYTLSGEKDVKLDLSGLHASNLCLWNCGMRHVNLSQAVLKNMQMINIELDDVDLRGADMSGLRLAPDKPIKSCCYWKDVKGMHLAALHENGQLMQYSFPENSLEHYSAKVLSKTKATDGVLRFGKELLLYSVKRLYDEKENELYHIENNNELRRIVTFTSDCCGFLIKRGDDSQVILFQGNTVPTAYILKMTDPNRVCITDKGNIFFVQDDSINLINQNAESRRLCEWESSYECFSVNIKSTGEICVYIKCAEKLIRIEFDEKMHVNTSYRKEFLIQGELEVMRELRVLNEKVLAAIGETDLFILSLEKKQEKEEVKSKRIRTDILINNSLLEDEGGRNRVQDAAAYELLYNSICQQKG